MRWLAVGFAIIVGLAVMVGAAFLLPPPTSGNGWRLDESGGRWGRPPFGGCTADAGPHEFALLIRRDRLPPLPFDVTARHHDRVVDLEVASLP